MNYLEVILATERIKRFGEGADGRATSSLEKALLEQEGLVEWTDWTHWTLHDAP